MSEDDVLEIIQEAYENPEYLTIFEYDFINNVYGTDYSDLTEPQLEVIYQLGKNFNMI